MKRTKIILLLILLFCLLGVKSSNSQTIITVPDAKFRTALLAMSKPENTITEIAGTNQISVFDVSEIRNLDVSGLGIADLAGIEEFTELMQLFCYSNSISDLDVSHNVKLGILMAFSNNISSIDVSKNTVLQELYVGYNPISSIDLSRNTILRVFYCHHTQITSLDLHLNTKLLEIKVNNSGIKSLNITGCRKFTSIECYNNQIESLDLSGCKSLVSLNCSNNHLNYLALPVSDSLKTLDCTANLLSVLDLTGLTGLTDVQTRGNSGLTDIYVKNAAAPLPVIQKDASSNLIQPVSISNPAFVITEPDSTYIPGPNGIIVKFENPGLTTGTIQASTGINPSVQGSLPSAISSVLPDKYWTLTSSGLGACSYSATFDLSQFSDLSKFDNMRVLQRYGTDQPWLNIAEADGVSVLNHKPYISISGLTSFGEFAVGTIKESPLPVELAGFSAMSDKAGVKLEWSTATEINSHIFTIERRSGSENIWIKIGEVAASGNSFSEKQYAFIDTKPVSGVKLYYRLKETDKDGTYKYFESIEFSGYSSPSEFALFDNYPNPFNPSTVIRYSLPLTCFVTLKIYDVLGNEIQTVVSNQETAGLHEITADLKGRASGIYLYCLRAGNIRAVRKMLLVK